MFLRLILIISAAATAAAFAYPALGDLLLLALPCAVASAILLLQSLRQGRRDWFIIDGSNVMFWKTGTPDILGVRDVVNELRARGLHTCVVFDANAGYRLNGRYQHDKALSRQLGLPANRVTVVPKGTPADPYILKAARDHGGRIVSRDQFRDWAETHPEVGKPGHLVKGGYRGGKLWLALDRDAAG